MGKVWKSNSAPLSFFGFLSDTDSAKDVLVVDVVVLVVELAAAPRLGLATSPSLASVELDAVSVSISCVRSFSVVNDILQNRKKKTN